MTTRTKMPVFIGAFLTALSLATFGAHAKDDVANDLKSSNCARFADEFVSGFGKSTTRQNFRILAVDNPSAPKDRLTIMLAASNGIPALSKDGGFWVHSPPAELVDEGARNLYEFISRYGGWLILVRQPGVPGATANVFFHSPLTNGPKCFRLDTFRILPENLPDASLTPYATN